ncbi:zinc ribbon domain-containing protein [bacterium]|nr:zinc ribbon domain-containing protein [bacterium]
MDIFFIVFVSLLILMIVIMLICLLKIEDAAAIEPVTQRDYESRYQALSEEIQILEDWVQRGAATHKMKTELERLRHQAKDLLRLLMPGMLNELPQDYQPSEENDSLGLPVFSRADQSDSQICSNCGSRVIAGDKFCANCGTQLHQRSKG